MANREKVVVREKVFEPITSAETLIIKAKNPQTSVSCIDSDRKSESVVSEISLFGSSTGGEAYPKQTTID